MAAFTNLKKKKGLQRLQSHLEAMVEANSDFFE